MDKTERIAEIKARCASVKTEVLLINGSGDIDFVPALKPTEIDGESTDIPWLLEQLAAAQAENERLTDACVFCGEPEHKPECPFLVIIKERQCER